VHIIVLFFAGHVVHGCRLPCSFLALALLGSYAVQSDLGNHNPLEHGSGSDYLKDIKFAPRQGDELLDKIAELHKTHRFVMAAFH